MSFFNFIFGKRASHQTADHSAEPGAAAARPARSRAGALPQAADERRIRRHARREQLYVAVRESMTRSGVLAASYQFKVLSLDQSGDEFLVMVSLSMDFEGITGRLGVMETVIIQHARARFGITVPMVYWRMDSAQAAAPFRPRPARKADKPPVSGAAMVAPNLAPDHPANASLHSDPLAADEVAAFRQALLAASAKPPAVVLDTATRMRRGISSYTLLTGFEDTELPESSASPGLSKTQYGDLG